MHSPIRLAALLCSLPLGTLPLFAQQTLTTTFAGGAHGYAQYFDLTVRPSAITLVGLDVAAEGSGTVELWRRDGTRLGHQTNATGWAQIFGTPVTGLAIGATTSLAVAPVTLASGVHGLCLNTLNSGTSLTLSQRTTNTAFTPGTVGNADLTIEAGETTNTLFTGPMAPNWVPNVGLRYLVGSWCELPTHFNIYNGFSRGFNFTAMTPFCLRQLALPPEAKVAGDTASYLVRVNGAVAFRSVGNPGAVTPNLNIHVGDVVDVIANWSPAVMSNSTAHNSYTTNLTTHTTLIQGVNHTLQRCGWQYDIGSPNWTTAAYLAPQNGQIGRIVMTTEPLSNATVATLGAGCGQQFGSAYEFFTQGTLDLANSALTFTLHSTGGETVTRAGALLPVGPGAVTLALGDDAEVTVPLTTSAFPGWSAVTISSNGTVAEATGNSYSYSYNPVISSLLNAPQTAFWCWHDFDPTATTGRVKVEQTPAVMTITWDGVVSYLGTVPNTVQFQLYPTGDVVLAFGALDVNTIRPWLIGFSPHGNSADPGPTNWSALGTGSRFLHYPEAGPLTLAANNAPMVGAPWNLTLSNVPSTGQFGLDVVGFTDPGFNDLNFLGMPGCGLRASLDVLSPWLYTGPTHGLSLGVPPLALLGTTVYTTTAVFSSPAMNAFGAVTSNGVSGTIGTP